MAWGQNKIAVTHAMKLTLNDGSFFTVVACVWNVGLEIDSEAQ